MAFATSPHGLGLSMARTWALTPREYRALRRVPEVQRDELRGIYAAIQATLHNAWLRPKGRRAFKADDFLPQSNEARVRDKQMLFRQVIEFQTRELPKAELPPQQEDVHDGS